MLRAPPLLVPRDLPGLGTVGKPSVGADFPCEAPSSRSLSQAELEIRFRGLNSSCLMCSLSTMML